MKQSIKCLGFENPGFAVVTGAAGGIGSEFARQLYNEGFSLFLTDLREMDIDEIICESNQRVTQPIITHVCNFAKKDEIDDIIVELDGISNIDILVNNAGFSTLGYFENNSIELTLEMMSVHNTAPVCLTRAVLPRMISQNRGVIINVSSLGVFTPAPQATIYGATKHFLNGFSKALSLELRDTNIQVQVLCPGFTDTDIFSSGDWIDYDFSKEPPRENWMSSEDVVRESLENLRKNKLVVVPGRSNRFFVWLSTKPIFRRIIERSIIRNRGLIRV